MPAPRPGEVLIRVTAAGVNFADISQARGTFGGGPQPPYLAGFEAAGEVAAVGAGVTGLEPGARVIGTNVAGQGAFAEYMVLPADAAVPVPAGWADEQALGVVVNWPTALAVWHLRAHRHRHRHPPDLLLRRPETGHRVRVRAGHGTSKGRLGTVVE